MFSSRKSSAPASGAVSLTKSLRFRSSASASLRRTFSTSGTNNKIRTISTWVKRGILGTVQVIMGGDDGGANQSRLLFQTDDTLNLRLGGSASNDNVTTAVFRDPSAWYHIVALIDTTQATAANRAKIYVNGVQQTIPSPTSIQNQTTAFANPSASNTIGEVGGTGSSYLDGYLTDFYFIDGQALTPSSFGATNATTGQWSPATYSGTYGTNGFHLTFANATSTTSLGYDTSGNSNNWTTNNISLTAGSTYDSMNDVPVAYSATAANYAVMNPLNTGSASSLSGGNLNFNLYSASGSVNQSQSIATIGVSSGKWYWESVWTTLNLGAIGVCNSAQTLDINPYSATNIRVYVNYSGGTKSNGNSASAYGASWATGDIIGVALDMNAGTITFYKNNTSQGIAYSDLSGQIWFPYLADYGSASSEIGSINFGQRPFTYTPPSGYNALNTYNLPTPTIAQGNKYMDATLWNGGQTSPFNVYNAGSFQPDFVWAKERSSAGSSRLYDVIRGTGVSLSSNSTGAEGTETNPGVSSFNSNGFTITNTYSPSVAPYLNDTSQTYVGWNWKAGGTAVSNTAGSITSSVSANTTAGFSIVNWTPSAGNDTVGHGLGVAPSMIIAKPRTQTSFWPVYHSALGPTKVMGLNLTDAQATSANQWNNTSPTSTVFSTASWFSNDGATIAYCFAQIAGFSAFGSYTGNGSTSGPFIYCGFQPRYVMFKRTDTAGYSWFIWDTARFIYNSNGAYLLANSSGSESPYTGINVLSNGFQLVNSVADFNASGGTYIYMAFASNPFAYSNAF